jgi:ParB family chromosome partitioning protein
MSPTIEKRRALGRGLESLLPSTRRQPPAETSGAVTAVSISAVAEHPQPTTAEPASPAVSSEEAVQQIAVELIDRNPYQTRRRMDEAALTELAASITSTGIVQPIVVRAVAGGRFQLIAGERRWLASQRARKTTIPAIVRQVSDEQAMEMTIVENLQREDLNPMEHARAYERLTRDFHLTQEQMAQRTGKDRASVANYLRLLRLPPEVQSDVEAGELSFGHAKVLMGLDSAEEMLSAAAIVRGRGLSVRMTEELIARWHDPVEVEQPQAERPVDPNVRAAEEELGRALGLRVKIKDRNGKGKITIEYATLEDFDRVVAQLGK